MHDDTGSELKRELDQHWLRLVLIAWVAVAVWFVWQRWGAIQWLALGDTDDNMRLMQVRALLGGQGWYDLRQYRLNPPGGFDMHWSRVVDLPIAALILALRPFVGTGMAERLACGIAPLLPLSVTMAALGFAVRRLVAPHAWTLAILLLLCCTATVQMFMPNRIDHHGWQLASLAAVVAGLADERRRRGGAVIGGATAFSLTIGLELLPYAAIAGGIVALRWIWDRAEAPRLAVYALSLSGGCATGYVLFASRANSVLRCDALTPVWLSVMVAAGMLAFAIAWANPSDRRVRLALAAVVGIVVVAGFALVFPQCLGRPEQVSDELARNWLNNVREAKPVYMHPLRSSLAVVTLPIIGAIGAAFATWRARGTDRLLAWVPVLMFTALSGALLLWQARAGPAAQLLAVPGATALAWVVLPWFLNHRLMPVRVLGTPAAFLLISGLFMGFAIKYLPIDRPGPRAAAVTRAGNRCPTLTTLRPLDRLPAQTIFTFIDLGPRLIATTHHSAVAGPYHRNGDAILDVQHAFKGSADQFRAIARRHGATLLMICPGMAESTVYQARAPQGFYAQLARGKVPAWLEPVPLPRRSPLKLWRIR